LIARFLTVKDSRQNCRKDSQQIHRHLSSGTHRKSRIRDRTAAKIRSKSHRHLSSDNHRKRFATEVPQRFAAKTIVICRQTITAKDSRQNCRKDSQRKPSSFFVRQSAQKICDRTAAKIRRKTHRHLSSGNQRKRFVTEVPQRFAAKAIVSCRQAITVKGSRQKQARRKY